MHLLARMQLVPPHEAVLAPTLASPRALLLPQIPAVTPVRDRHRSGRPVQIPRGISVDGAEDRPGVEQGEMGAGIAPRDQEFVGGLEFEDLVGGGG